ncbi:Cell surface protein with WxL domain [Carnobacterium maltaromaticum]|uniref:WxL domain-containing protein n=1 Tax=Carnobacterium maltaromaticum TaxID=2751 RepID=A0AAW9K1D9_CARML|nr:WxL domain-containing protein [Carnobacterium maltaromaticum]MDZ5759690.1 WxL domain-containing protein [Carnobacterium maltaromaticum]CAD5896717.1 Cell surface protein with WxL domain [Carnobacterium maltaromaticum]
MKLTKIITISAITLIALGTTTSVLAADGGTYKSTGSIEFTPSTDTTKPTDPTDPTKPVEPINPGGETPDPGTAGPLSIDFVSSVSFGKNKITNKDVTYFADPQKLVDGTEKPNYVQVTDTRGTNGGWILTVKQEGQLKNETTTNKELTGAVLSFKDGKAVSAAMGVTAPSVNDVVLNPAGASSTIMSAEKGAGALSWLDVFGTLEDETVEGESVQKNKAITLEIPGTTPKDAVKYSTNLTWTLNDVPTSEVE